MPDVPGPELLHGYRLRDYDDLVATLANARISRGIPVAELARRIRASRWQVSRWLTGELPMLASVAVAVADEFGLDLALIPRDAEPDPSGWNWRRTPGGGWYSGPDAEMPRARPSVAPGGDGDPSRGSSDGPDDPNALASAYPASCDCGHEGLDPMFHLRPCPIAEQRAAERTRKAIEP